MPTVHEIIDRLAKEDAVYGLYRPGLGTSRTEVFKAIEENGNSVSKYLPNRKVVSGLVAGAVAAVAVKLTGAELSPDVSAAVVTVAMSVISYLVPLPEAPAE